MYVGDSLRWEVKITREVINMKKIICLILGLCLFTSLVFATEPLLRQNYIVQKQSRIAYVIPGLIFGYGAYQIWVESEREKNKEYRTPLIVTSWITALESLSCFIIAMIPKKTYLFPKLDKDGTIWFEKNIWSEKDI